MTHTAWFQRGDLAAAPRDTSPTRWPRPPMIIRGVMLSPTERNCECRRPDRLHSHDHCGSGRLDVRLRPGLQHHGQRAGDKARYSR
jgi:hypothetical protein